MNVLMACGHTAQGTDSNGNPVCVICVGLDAGATIPASTVVDLTGRFAKCTYRHVEEDKVPSSTSLAFFEYRGPGSPRSQEICKNCKYHIKGHERSGMNNNLRICSNFEPIGPYEFDTYYDGCRGWD